MENNKKNASFSSTKSGFTGLSNTQQSFRSALSTSTALLTQSHKLYSNMDRKKLSLISLCDLFKAFHSVRHQILIEKCAMINIESFCLHNYLQNRTQSVCMGNYVLIKQDITFGVTQGSVLGHIWLNIYVNDLSHFIRDCPVIQYADATQFILTGTTDNIQDLTCKCGETLTKVKQYFHTNGVMLNTTKTQCMFVGTQGNLLHIPSDVSIQVDGSTITPHTSIKNLAIYIYIWYLEFQSGFRILIFLYLESRFTCK